MKVDLFLSRLHKIALLFSSPKLLFVFIRFGVLPTSEHRYIIKKNLRTIVDIGANKGQFSLACSQWSGGAKIFAFEPLPGPAQVYESIFSRDTLFHLKRVAIGPVSGLRLIHVSSRDDSSSLLPIGLNQVANFPGTKKKYEAEISVLRLSDCIDEKDISTPAMLKLDVQGYEFEALRGCESLLHKFNYIYCECSFIELYVGQKLAHEVIAWLTSHNFYLEGIFNVSYSDEGQAIQADFLFKLRCPHNSG